MNAPKRCPECHSGGISERKSKALTYRCQNGHEFNEPVTLLDAVKTRIRSEPGQTLRSLRIGLDLGIAPQKELSLLEDAGKVERREVEQGPTEWHPPSSVIRQVNYHNSRLRCRGCGTFRSITEAVGDSPNDAYADVDATPCPRCGTNTATRTPEGPYA